MKKLFYYLSMALLLITFNACNDKNGDDPDKVKQEAIDALLANGGTLQTQSAKSEVATVSRDTMPKIMYTDPASGLEYDAYPVKTVKHYSVVDNPMEFVTLDPWDMLWPGALIQGASIRNGVPSSIPIYSKRLPGRVYLSLVSGSQDMDTWYKEVPMRGSEVTQGMNELMSQYLGSSIPARTSFEIKAVSSVEELALKFGINLSLFGGKLKTEFGNSWNKQKTYVAVKLNQLFFTMTYEGPDGGFSGTFTNDITTDDLKNYTGTGNPICYVASVSYGRSFILLYESDKSSREMEFALNVAYKGITVSSELTQKNIVNSSSCKMVQIGGNPQAGLEAAFGDFSKIREFVVNGAVVSSTNVGAPLSYKIVHLKDNSPACLSNTLEYDVTTTEYSAVYPNNNVVIDIFNAESAALSAIDKKNVSNHSRMQLQNLTVSYGPVENVTQIKLKYPFDESSIGSKDGVNIPIYNTYLLPSVDKTKRIQINCKFYVKNETYSGGTDVGTEVVDLYQIFEYNTMLNKWQPVNTKDGHRPFEELCLFRKIGDANTDFKLSYRFSCDGRVYSYSEDGSGN